MDKSKLFKLNLIMAVLWTTNAFSVLALIYHIRWFISYLINETTYVVPTNQIPTIWFLTQIISNLIFLYVGYLLVGLFKRYTFSGFFDEKSIKVLDGVLLSCLFLAILGSIQVLINNFSEVHISDWESMESSLNLIFRSFTKLFVFSSPDNVFSFSNYYMVY